MPQKGYKIDYLDEARDELGEVFDLHLALVGPMSAQRITDRITDSIGNLSTSPYMGMPCRDKRLATAGYRYLICGNYLCFYRVIEEIIYICHILDGRTDYEKNLTDLPE